MNLPSIGFGLQLMLKSQQEAENHPLSLVPPEQQAASVSWLRDLRFVCPVGTRCTIAMPLQYGLVLASGHQGRRVEPWRVCGADGFDRDALEPVRMR